MGLDLALLDVYTGMAAVRPGRRFFAVARLAAVSWLLMDHPVEGPVLLRLDSRHGVTLGDQLAVLAVLVAALRWAWSRRAR